MHNGEVSFWSAQLTPEPGRAGLDGDLDADVVVVGGGLTGLWAAYYLRETFPDARIVVVEARFCGFGASGRNGGWMSAEVPGNRERYARIAESRGRDGLDANRALTRALEDTVAEVLTRLRSEGISADEVHSGVLNVARCEAQLRRLHNDVDESRRLGTTGLQILDAAELGDQLTVADGLGASWSPHCARVQPALLTRGLAETVERRGVRIVEGTVAQEIGAHRVRTDRGTIRADHVLVCVEGFTAALPGNRRKLLPLNSSMVVTEPLPAAAWDEIGWDGAELLGDYAHAYTYAQHTADGRIAMGGRGIPYRFGSRIDHDGATQRRTADAITVALRERFPAAARTPIAHSWCGVLGVHRDWCTSITYDRTTGVGQASGFVGSGLSMTNLAGRTLRDLIVGEQTELTDLPWVGHRSPDWEPEPLRYLGVSSMYAAYRAADRGEMAGRCAETSRIARLADRISGR